MISNFLILMLIFCKEKMDNKTSRKNNSNPQSDAFIIV